MTSLLDILGLLETDSNKSLVESIRKGYLLIFENTSKSLVLYRGQNKYVDKFSVSDNVASSLGKGIYMTDTPELAKEYSNKYLYKSSVTLNNPFVMDWRTDAGRDASVENGSIIGLEINPGNWIEGNGEDITKKLTDNGYDSVIVKQPSSDSFPEHLEVVVFNTSNISIEDVIDLQKSMTEAIDYRRSDDAEAFLNKYGISEDDLNYLGSGDFGSAYSIGNDKVLKITSSKSEANLAHQIMNGKFSSFVRIYAVEPIDNSYFILQEELEEDSDIENMWYEVEEALQSQGLPVQYIANFDEDEYIEQGGEISDDAREFMNDLWGISSDYRRLGIEASDIRPENLGRASDGTIKAFDIDDRKR